MTSLQENNENLGQEIFELTLNLELKEKEIEQMKSPPKVSNQFETQSLELYLIQIQAFAILVENEKEQLQNILAQMISSQLEAQKETLKQKQQMQNVKKIQCFFLHKNKKKEARLNLLLINQKIKKRINKMHQAQIQKPYQNE